MVDDDEDDDDDVVVVSSDDDGDAGPVSCQGHDHWIYGRWQPSGRCQHWNGHSWVSGCHWIGGYPGGGGAGVGGQGAGGGGGGGGGNKGSWEGEGPPFVGDCNSVNISGALITGGLDDSGSDVNKKKVEVYNPVSQRQFL